MNEELASWPPPLTETIVNQIPSANSGEIIVQKFEDPRISAGRDPVTGFLSFLGSIGAIIGFVFLAVIVTYIVSFLTNFEAFPSDLDEEQGLAISGPVLVVSIFVQQLVFILYPIVVMKMRAGSIRDSLGLKAKWKTDIPLGLIGTFLALAYVVTASAIITESGAELPSNADALEGPTGFVLWAIVFFTAIGAPLSEEIYFRGYLQFGIQRHWGLIASVIIPSLLFTMVHAPSSGEGFLLLWLVLGGPALIFAYMAARTGRITAGIITHLLYNSFVSIQLLAEPSSAISIMELI